MSAGTLTLTNNSASVSGSGTSFATELAAADFIVVTVGGIPYTLPVKTVDSTTALTLVSNYTGPTQAGAAWYAVPRVAMNLVTAALVAQSAEALRGLNYDKQNWQQIFAGSGTATIKIPDGTSFTGPTWNSLATSLASKADKTALDGKADKSSLGDAAGKNIGTTSGTVAAGDDTRISGALQKTGGTVSGYTSFSGGVSVSATGGFTIVGAGGAANNNIDVVSGSGNTPATGFVAAFNYKWYNDAWAAGVTRGGGTNTISYAIYYNGASGTSDRLWSFYVDGNASGPGAWVNGSDERHKSAITEVGDALAAVIGWRGATYNVKDGGRSVGLIAQDVERVCPEAIKVYGDRTFSDGTVIKGFKYLDTAGAAAAFHTEAIKTLFSLLDLALSDPDKARAEIAAVKDLADLNHSGS